MGRMHIVSAVFHVPYSREELLQQGRAVRAADQDTPVKECKRMPLNRKPPAWRTAGLWQRQSRKLQVIPVPVGPSMAVYRDPATVEHPPPDLNVLHATFLI